MASIQMQAIHARGRRFKGADGREAILSGINLVCKDKALGYVTPCDETLFARLRLAGVNVLRLGLIWDGIEPQPGMYDDAYLAQIRRQADWAAQNGIYVFLDMHQDLYSVCYGDGAPAWATLTDGLAHATGDHWGDAYLLSPALNQAIDHFWANASAPDGIGLMDHYAAMWRHVATFFGGCGNVIGYDLMNEPHPGSRAAALSEAIARAIASELPRAVEPAKGVALWTNDASKQALLTAIADPEVYRRLAESVSPYALPFERDTLMPFYERVARAIRAVDVTRMLFVETGYFANIGIKSGVERIVDGGPQAFAPHAYDLVVDTAHYENYNQPRVDYTLQMHRGRQEVLDMPLLLGEWGAFDDAPVTERLSDAILRIVDENLWSQTYWCWQEGYFDSPAARAICRPYPMWTAGTLQSFERCAQDGAFVMRYHAVPGVTEIYHPDVAGLSVRDVVVRGGTGESTSAAIALCPYAGARSGIVQIAFPDDVPQGLPVVVQIGNPAS